jgi:hypothetical protein
MRLLAVFFAFDFAINFLSALLKAAKEQAYLLKATAAAAAGFGLLLLALPPPDGACLMGAFITAQAAWAVLLLLRVVSRWPGAAVRPGLTAPGAWRPGEGGLGSLSGAGAARPRLTTTPLSHSPEGRKRAGGPTSDQDVESVEPADRLLIMFPKIATNGATCDGPLTTKHWPATPGPARPCAGPLG